jgi:hypothetical protein
MIRNKSVDHFHAWRARVVRGLVIGVCALVIVGCSGSDGAMGPAGPQGASGSTGAAGAAGSTGPSGPGINWINVTGTSAQAASNTGYLANNAAQVTITLPTTPALGDLVQVSGVATGGWKVAQNAGQQVRVGYENVQWVPRGPSQDWQAVAASADARKLAAIVNGGPIYTSADFGYTWTAQASGSLGWSSIASSADGTKLVATVAGGEIYTSSDSGVTWLPRTALALQWAAVASSADGTKMAAVAHDFGTNSGLIYTSTDAGGTWTLQSSTANFYWFSIASSMDGTTLVAAGSSAFGAGAQIQISVDSGVNWTTVQTGLGISVWIKVVCSSDCSHIAAMGTLGLNLSMDSGATWVSDAARKGSVIAMSADGNTLFSVETSVISLSTDAGITWTPLNSPEGWLSIACSADAQRIIATTGYGGHIYNPTQITTSGVAGFVSGTQYQALTLQYFGNGLFSLLQNDGMLQVQ